MRFRTPVRPYQPVAKVADPAWPRRGRVSYTERHGDGQETGGATGVADVGGHGGPSDERWASLLRAAEPGPGGFRVRCVRRGVVRGELCAAFYADRLGRPSLRPGRYFRMLFIGYFEGLTPLYVKNARGSTTARSVRGELKALASLGSRSPRTVNHGRQPAARVLRCAPALRVTAAADRAGSPCGPAGRLARDPLPGSATPASHSVVAENRRQTPEWDRVHLPDRGFAVARTIRKHAVGILAYLDTRMTERARGRTHPARPTG